jgi:hypothetical protein
MARIHPAALLDQTRAHIARFTCMPSDSALTLTTLWVAHTHVRGTNDLLAFDTTPRIAFVGDEPGCGKTTALEAVMRLSFNGEQVIDPTPASFAELISESHATAGIDEIDVLFGAGAAKSTLRSLLNAGYKHGAEWKRKGQTSIPLLAPVALAGLGTKFRTAEVLSPLRQRSIVVNMRRKTPAESYRGRLHDPMTAVLRGELTRYGKRYREQITSLWPEDIPEGISDRLYEVCEPLFMVADHAGGDWPQMARKAAADILLGQTDDDDEPESISDTLIRDVLRVIGQRKHIGTHELAASLRDLDGAPWAKLWPAPDGAARELTAMLRPLGLEPSAVRANGGAPVKGYKRMDIELCADDDDE